MTTTKILFAELADLHAKLGWAPPSATLLKRSKDITVQMLSMARSEWALAVAPKVQVDKVGGRMKKYLSTDVVPTTRLSPQMTALVNAAKSFGDQPFDLRQLGARAVEHGMDTVRCSYHLAHKNKVELIERGFIRHSTDAEREHRRFMAHRMIQVRQKEI